MSNGRKYTIHGKDILLNKNKLKAILDSKKIDDKGMDYIELHRRICERFNLNLSYKGFMSLLHNRSTWKLLYAYAIVDVLEIDFKDIFDVVEIDTDKALKEKQERKMKYEKN